MKSFNNKIVIPIILISILLGIINTTLISSFSVRGEQLSLNYHTHIRYGEYKASFNVVYTYNIIEWSFTTNNQAEIIVLKMDHMNYLKFDINDTNAEFQVLSENRKEDNGFFIVPYDNEWVILFFNANSSLSRTDIDIEVDVLYNPIFYFFLPLALVLSVISLFTIISIYYKRMNKENKVGPCFCGYLMFLFVYLYACWGIFPLIQYLR